MASPSPASSSSSSSSPSSPANGSMTASNALLSLSHASNDFLHVAMNASIVKFLLQQQKTEKRQTIETVLFSDQVLKINKRNVSQPRDLILTSSSLYNFRCESYNSCQRCIPLSLLLGVVLEKGGDELLVRVRDQHDYRFVVVKQAAFLKELCAAFANVMAGASLSVEVRGDIGQIQVMKGKTGETPIPSPSSSSSSSSSYQSSISRLSAVSISARRSITSLSDSLSNSGRNSDDAHSHTPPTIQGFLTKRGRVNLIWRRRYFRLSGSNLLYYEARLKGCVSLHQGGDVRLLSSSISSTDGSVVAAAGSNAGSTSTPSSPSSSASTETRMYDILNDATSFASFVAFCQKHNLQSHDVERPTEGGDAESRSAAPSSPSRTINMSGCPLFYVAVQKLTAIKSSSTPSGVSPTSSSSSSSSPLSSDADDARDIYDRYLSLASPRATLPISGVPNAIIEALADLLRREQNKKNLPADAASADSPSSSSSSSSATSIYAPLLTLCQQLVFTRMHSIILPLYLLMSQSPSSPSSASAASPSASSASAQVAPSADSAAPKKSNCTGCMATFGLIKRRYGCGSCKDIFCSSCLSHRTVLPASSSSAAPPSPSSSAASVCDFCFHALNPSSGSSSFTPGSGSGSSADPPPEYSFALLAMSRPGHPVKLAAVGGEQQRQEWIDAMKLALKPLPTPSAPAATPAAPNATTPTSSSSNGATFAPAIVISAPAQPPASKEGFLMKQDPTSLQWRPRYVLLNLATRQLFYYEMVLKGSLSLSVGSGVHATVPRPTIQPEEDPWAGMASRSLFGYPFHVSSAPLSQTSNADPNQPQPTHSERLYALAADSAEQQARWVQALQLAISRTAPGAAGPAGIVGQSRGGKRTSSFYLHDASASLLFNPPPTSPSPPSIAQHASSSSKALSQYSSSFLQPAPDSSAAGQGEVCFVFTDIESSTNMWEAAPGDMDQSVEAHDTLMRMMLKVFNGYEVKTEGDAFMVTFFNVVDAVRWCLASQTALLEHSWPSGLLRHDKVRPIYASTSSTSSSHPSSQLVFSGLRVRMGLHCGSPACRRNPVTGRMDYFGPVVNRSARVADSAHGGQVVCTSEVQLKLREAMDAGEFPSSSSAASSLVLTELGGFKYKGISEPVTVWQISNTRLAGRNPFKPLRTTKSDPPPIANDAAISDTNASSSSSSPAPVVSPSRQATLTSPIVIAALVDASSSSSSQSSSTSTIPKPTLTIKDDFECDRDEDDGEEDIQRMSSDDDDDDDDDEDGEGDVDIQ